MSSLVRTVVTLVWMLVWPVAAFGAGTELGLGVWLDDDTAALIVGVPGERLAAYRVADGTRLWRSRTVARPVLIVGEHVVAFENARRAGRLRLLSVGKRDGKRVARSVADLPPAVMASVAADVKSRFLLRPHAAFPASRVVWEFTPESMNDSGVRALPQAGVLSIDPPTARAGALDETPPPRDARSARLNVPFAGTSDPAFFSADRKHIIVSRRRADAPGFEWALYDRDALLLGRITATAAYAPFIVRGDLMVTLHASATGWRANNTKAPRLRAVDWRRGERRWERTLSADQTR